MKSCKEYSLEILSRFFVYIPSTGEVRKSDSTYYKSKTGFSTGLSKNSRGYLTVRYKDESFLAHRVAWLLYYGSLPEGLVIDHINKDKTDNRINNLRAVSNADNLRRGGLRKNNKSGVVGVYYNNNTKFWEASITVNRKKIHLGISRIKSEAITLRESANELYCI